MKSQTSPNQDPYLSPSWKTGKIYTQESGKLIQYMEWDIEKSVKQRKKSSCERFDYIENRTKPDLARVSVSVNFTCLKVWVRLQFLK